MRLSEIGGKNSLDSPEQPRKRIFSTELQEKTENHSDLTLINEPNSFHVAFGRKIKRRQNITNPEEIFQFLQRKETIHKELIERHLKITICPENRYLKCFKKFTSVLVWYSVIISLSYLAYNDDISDHTIIDDFIWGFFLIEFILEHFTCYYNIKKEKVANIPLIFRHYVKKTFFIDFISLLPLRWFGHPFSEYMLRTLRIFKMKDITKLFDINMISNYISRLFYVPGSFSDKRLKHKLNLIFDILIIAVKMLLGTYFFACTWYSFSNMIQRKDYEKIDFYKRFDIERKSKGSKLMITWYFIFTTVATVGYGDFSAVNKYEMGYAILLVLIGSTWFAFLMGKSVKIIESLSDLNGLRDIRDSLSIWISNIDENYSHLPYKLKQKIILHYLNHWQNDRLQALRYIVYKNGLEDSYIYKPYFNEMPEKLKRSLVDYFYCEIYYQFIHFFKYFDKIKYELTLHLHPRVFTPGSFILKFNKIPHEIYFIDYGSFSIGVNKKEDWKELSVVTKKFLIGDYFILTGIKSFVGFRANSTVRGFGLPAHILKRYIKDYNIDCKDFTEFVKSGYNSLLDDSTSILSNTEFKRTSISLINSPPKYSWRRLRASLTFEDIPKPETSVLSQADLVTEGLTRLKTQRSKLIKTIRSRLTDLLLSRLTP